MKRIDETKKEKGKDREVERKRDDKETRCTSPGRARPDSQDGAESVAMSRFIGPETSVLGFGVSVSTPCESRLTAILRPTTLSLLPLLAQHADDIIEGLFDIDAILGRGLDEFTT